jgi:hypothetical protein
MAPILKAQAPAPQTKAAQPQEPAYVYLYATVADQVNLDITEDRLRRLLPMVERFRSGHPGAHVVATILFSGAVSQALDERNAKTHIKDFILDYKKRGVIEVGYDGTDEPTYKNRPMFVIPEKSTYEGRWVMRADADEKFLTEGRDPVTGAPIPGSVGGLEEMQRVFGEAACIRAAGANEKLIPPAIRPVPPHIIPPSAAATPPHEIPDFRPDIGDWEIDSVLRKYNTKAILFGIAEGNAFRIPGFHGAVQVVTETESPVPNSSPELYWANNILHTSEWSGGHEQTVRTLHGYEGVDVLKDFAASIDRSKVQIIHMELASEQDYLKADFTKNLFSATSSSPSLAYAYAHPDNPKVPAEARLTADEVNAAYAKEDAALKWVAEDFFRSSAGSHFLASSDFERMTPPSTGYSISVAALQPALSKMLVKWGTDTFPPNYLLADGHYLSLADLFQVMTDALAELNRTGKLPQSVKVIKVYGPVGLQPSHGPNVGELTVARIAKECSEIAPGLHDDKADPMPHNSIPPGLIVDGTAINSAQFLRLMAQAMVNPVPDTKLGIKMTYMYNAISELLPRTRSITDTGAAWTFKPAPLEGPGINPGDKR